MDNHYSGNCHCKAVTFTVNTGLESPFTCNCSFCIRRSTILTKVSEEDFELLTGKDFLSTYGNSGFSRHFFCSNCGIQCFSKITRPEANSIIVNLGCLQGVNISALNPTVFDGANKL